MRPKRTCTSAPSTDSTPPCTGRRSVGSVPTSWSCEGCCRWRTRVWPISDCPPRRSEEHTSELQSLMRISYAVFCLKKKKKLIKRNQNHTFNVDKMNKQHTEKTNT